MAQLDLSVGPLRLEVPDTGSRYYVLQFVDAWTNNIAYIGTRATGNRAGRYLITPPGWDGQIPDGHTRIPVSTTVASIVGRFACTGPDDIPAVAALQDDLVLAPAAEDAPEPVGVPVAGPAASEELLFWDQARAWSITFPAPPQDEHYTELYAPLGFRDRAASVTGGLDAALIAGYRAGVQKLT